MKNIFVAVAILLSLNVHAQITTSPGGGNGGGGSATNLTPWPSTIDAAGNDLTGAGTLNAANFAGGVFTGNGRGLTNNTDSPCVVLIHGQFRTNYYGSANSTRGAAFTNALLAANSGDKIELGPGTFLCTLGNVLPPPGVTIIGKGPGTIIHGTNVNSNPSVNPPILIRASSGLTIMDLVISNRAPDISSTNVYAFPVGSINSDTAATNFLLRNVTIYGDSDVFGFRSTNGPTTGLVDNCDTYSGWDTFAEIVNTFTGGKITFNNSRFTSTNPIPIAASIVGFGPRLINLELFNCFININPSTNSGIIVGLKNAGTSTVKIYNSVIDLFGTNSFDLYTASSTTTNLFYSNFTRKNGGPLRINNFNAGGGGPVEKLDNSTIVVAQYDITTNASFTANLIYRGLGARLRARVDQSCTSAGSSGTNSVVIGFTDGNEVDHAIQPSVNLDCTSTDNVVGGTADFLQGTFQFGTSSTEWITITSTLIAGAGSPAFRVIVTLEQVGSN